MYRSLLVMWPLQRLLSDKRQNIHSFCLMRQNRQYQLYWLMCNWMSGFGFGLDIGVHNFIFSNMDWVWSRWKSFGLDQDCKISISVHHCSLLNTWLADSEHELVSFLSLLEVSFSWATPFPLALYNYKLIHFSSHSSGLSWYPKFELQEEQLQS